MSSLLIPAKPLLRLLFTCFLLGAKLLETNACIPALAGLGSLARAGAGAFQAVGVAAVTNPGAVAVGTAAAVGIGVGVGVGVAATSNGRKTDEQTEKDEQVRRHKEWIDSMFKRATLFGDRLYPFQKLGVDQFLKSSAGTHVAVLQSDGNFVVYDRKGEPNFSSGTYRHNTIRYLALLTDGRLVLNSLGSTVWSNVPVGKAGSCAKDRCVLILQNDGNLVAYKGEIDSSNAFWASLYKPPPGGFEAVLGRTNQPTCPVYGPVRSISFDITVRNDRRNRRRRSSKGDYGNPSNVFRRFDRSNPDWISDPENGYITEELQEYRSSTGQRVYYFQRPTVNGVQRTEYIRAYIRPEDLNQGQQAGVRSRQRRDELLRASGLSNPPNEGVRRAENSWDAGHILANLLGGRSEDCLWNIFPQNGIINRNDWRNTERDVADVLIRNRRLFAVAEYWLEYGNYGTIPTFVHYSFRFYDSITGRYVQQLTGMYPNTLIDGQPRNYRLAFDLNQSRSILTEVLLENTPLIENYTEEELDRIFLYNMEMGFNCFDFGPSSRSRSR